jgi:hypothetical protein
MRDKQTIVEWQFEELFNSFEKYHSGKYTFGEYLSHNLKVINTAKEKEKLQRISDFRAGIECESDHHGYMWTGKDYPEEWYKENCEGSEQ